MNNIPYSEIPKVVLVCRKTRYRELLVKYQTVSNARFYLESLGADFNDYVTEDKIYEQSLQVITRELQQWGRYQIIDRQHLPNYVFAEDDIVIVLGQDGTVANTLKYLTVQPLIGINPDANRWDGLLLPFTSKDIATLLPEVAKKKRTLSEVTMAEVNLTDGQRMLAVNDFFIGTRTHTSSFYDIEYQGVTEKHSSSGLIVSTGLGSTAWLSSVVAGSMAIAGCVMNSGSPAVDPASLANDASQLTRMPWDTNQLVFAVREPFVTRTTSANIVFGKIPRDAPLTIRSNMPDTGVIFSDGIESDFIRFDAGLEASVKVSEQRGHLVH